MKSGIQDAFDFIQRSSSQIMPLAHSPFIIGLGSVYVAGDGVYVRLIKMFWNHLQLCSEAICRLLCHQDKELPCEF